MSESPGPRRRAPKFTPLPLRYRKDGWTPMRRADFLGRLAELRSVAAAARQAGMTGESAYCLRDKPGADSFAGARDAILVEPSGDGARKSTHGLALAPRFLPHAEAHYARRQACRDACKFR